MRLEGILVPLALLPFTRGRDTGESLRLDDDINPLGFNQHVIMASSLNGTYSVSSTQGSQVRGRSFEGGVQWALLDGDFEDLIPR